MTQTLLDDKRVLIRHKQIKEDDKTKFPSLYARNCVVKYKCLLIVTLVLYAMQFLPRIGCEQRQTTTMTYKIIVKRSIDTTEKVPRLGKYSIEIFRWKLL